MPGALELTVETHVVRLQPGGTVGIETLGERLAAICRRCFSSVVMAHRLAMIGPVTIMILRALMIGKSSRGVLM